MAAPSSFPPCYLISFALKMLGFWLSVVGVNFGKCCIRKKPSELKFSNLFSCRWDRIFSFFSVLCQLRSNCLPDLKPQLPLLTGCQFSLLLPQSVLVEQKCSQVIKCSLNPTVTLSMDFSSNYKSIRLLNATYDPICVLCEVSTRDQQNALTCLHTRSLATAPNSTALPAAVVSMLHFCFAVCGNGRGC